MIGGVHAVAVVGVFLMEAVVLFVAYGSLEERLGPAVIGRLQET